MCSPNKIINEIFTPFQSYVNAEQDIREVILTYRYIVINFHKVFIFF